jgi:hypothetical protein
MKPGEMQGNDLKATNKAMMRTFSPGFLLTHALSG